MMLNVVENFQKSRNPQRAQKQPAQFHIKGVVGGFGHPSLSPHGEGPKPGVARDSRLMPVPIATADTRRCAYGFAFRTILTRYAFRFSRSSGVSAPGSHDGCCD